MNARNVFGIIVRSVGILLLPASVYFLTVGLGLTFGFSGMNHGWFYEESPFVCLLLGIPAFVVAVGLMRFARQIVRFSYPVNKDDADA